MKKNPAPTPTRTATENVEFYSVQINVYKKLAQPNIFMYTYIGMSEPGTDGLMSALNVCWEARVFLFSLYIYVTLRYLVYDTHISYVAYFECSAAVVVVAAAFLSFASLTTTASQLIPNMNVIPIFYLNAISRRTRPYVIDKCDVFTIVTVLRMVFCVFICCCCCFHSFIFVSLHRLLWVCFYVVSSFRSDFFSCFPSFVRRLFVVALGMFICWSHANRSSLQPRREWEKKRERSHTQIGIVSQGTCRRGYAINIYNFFSYFFFLFYISVFCSLLLCHHSVVLICGYLLFFSWRCYRSIYRNLLHRCVRVCISSETHRKREREKERAAHKQIIYQICGIQWLYGWTRHLMLSSLWPNGLYAWILWHSYCHFAWPLPANQPFTNAYGFYNIRSRKYTNLDYKQPIYRRRCDRKSTFTNTQLCTIQCLSVSLTRSHCFYWHGFFSAVRLIFYCSRNFFVDL